MTRIIETPTSLQVLEAYQCKLQQIMLLRPDFHVNELLSVPDNEMETRLEWRDRHADHDRTKEIWAKGLPMTNTMRETLPDRETPYSTKVPQHRICRTDRIFDPEIHAREVEAIYRMSRTMLGATTGRPRSSTDRAHSLDPAMLVCAPVMSEEVLNLLPDQLPPVTSIAPTVPDSNQGNYQLTWNWLALLRHACGYTNNTESYRYLPDFGLPALPCDNSEVLWSYFHVRT